MTAAAVTYMRRMQRFVSAMHVAEWRAGQLAGQRMVGQMVLDDVLLADRVIAHRRWLVVRLAFSIAAHVASRC